ncbi:MAG TPA: hypothetical protein VMU45_11980, partial [Candidatus Eisenbacteria bacterium]|nr:hypothetical protein [Candidatus Eisenbacteria bacterium]
MSCGDRTRREVLQMGGRLLLLAPLTAVPQFSACSERDLKPLPATAPYAGTDEQLLDEIERAA